ncbi:MAG: ABC transporter permease [Candidatus Omnitrophica bacterium]|nr:ABC transporter permease [Candidatus Omnitrophota bacterium]MDD5437210.1 ABC transporter permease [Candidatus Omnitrophota bacterium]
MKIFFENKMAVVSLVFIAMILVFAIFAPLVARYDPSAIDTNSILTAPSSAHIFGTDTLGRDIFSRIVYGSRISLSIGIIAVGIAVLIGIFFGSIAGYYGGKVDSIIMRFVDMMLCFPTFFLILAVIAVLEPSIFNIMVVIGLTGWMGVARLVRAEVLTLKERDFAWASKVMGASDAWIIARHLIPNAIGPVLVSATLGIGGAILTESALSFLGIGVQPPTPSWGNILMDGKSTLGVAWWLTIFPGLFILFTVLSYNLLSEGLRDALEPKLKEPQR